MKHKKEEVENREEKMREKTRESIHKKDHQISALLYLNTYIIWCSSTWEKWWKQAQERENVKIKLSSHLAFYLILEPTTSDASQMKGREEEKRRRQEKIKEKNKELLLNIYSKVYHCTYNA